MTADSYKNLVRLYVAHEEPAVGKKCVLSDRQLHYLRNVMRIQPGDLLRSFDGTQGEWLAKVEEVSKKNAVISFLEKIREQKPSPDIHVLASPVKKDAFDMMVEKSSELGVFSFCPVVCDNTVIHRANEDRLQTIAIEAAEQCERLDIMHVRPLLPLKEALTVWDPQRRLVLCLERAKAPPILPRLAEAGVKAPLAVLVGPEGGFSEEEAALLQRLPYVETVSLGPRILRAETALIAALACIQAQVGDWGS